jgi:hypothetical protein
MLHHAFYGFFRYFYGLTLKYTRVGISLSSHSQKASPSLESRDIPWVVELALLQRPCLTPR